MAKKNEKVLGLVLGLTGAAALSAVGFGAVRFWQWAKDPYSTELWFGFRIGGKGIRIVKGEEKNSYRVETGYRWHPDIGEAECAEEPELEIPLTEVLDPEGETAPDAEPEGDPAPDDGDEA